MDTVTINRTQLLDLLNSSLNGYTFIGLSTITKQNLLNKGRGESAMINQIGIDPDSILKKCRTGVYIASALTMPNGHSVYETLVNNRNLKEQRQKEVKNPASNFTALERRWGNRVNGFHVTHKDKDYLTAYFITNNIPKVEYVYQGNPIDIKDSKFDPWRKPERVEGERQPCESPIVVRDYSFESIVQVRFNKTIYDIVD